MIRIHVDRDGAAVRHVHLSIPASGLASAARRFRDWYDGDTLALLILIELLDAVSK